jgi:hypothetical protein
MSKVARWWILVLCVLVTLQSAAFSLHIRSVVKHKGTSTHISHGVHQRVQAVSVSAKEPVCESPGKCITAFQLTMRKEASLHLHMLAAETPASQSEYFESFITSPPELRPKQLV